MTERLLAKQLPAKGPSLWRRLPAKLIRLLRSGRHLAFPDDPWATARLESAERALFLQMDPRDREHAIRVARRLLEHDPGLDARLVRAALLHDCAKLLRPYRTIERFMLAFLPPARWDNAQVRMVLSGHRRGHEGGHLRDLEPLRIWATGWLGRDGRVPDAQPVWEGLYINAIRLRRDHALLGAVLVQIAGGDERVAELVAIHHHPGDDVGAALLHAADRLE